MEVTLEPLESLESLERDLESLERDLELILEVLLLDLLDRRELIESRTCSKRT